MVGWLPFGVSTCTEVHDLSRLQDSPECWLLSSGRVFPPFVRALALLFVVSLADMALFRVLRAFWRVLGVSCGFVLLGCFAWLVWLLCACGVRRIKGLWRICLRFSSFVLVFALLLCSSPIFWGFTFVVLWLSCLPVLFVLGFFGLLFLFPFRMHGQKERAQFLASSLVLLCVVC